MTTPEWLEQLTRAGIEEGALPLKEILKGCCYYPASETDGTPVRAYGDRVSSFVYVDWSLSLEKLLSAVETEPFTGYRVLGHRHVPEIELNPSRFVPEKPDSLLDEYFNKVPAAARASAFAHWFVWERLDGFGDDHGPGRFSTLHRRADGAATYQVLFQGNRTLPLIVCCIKPGSGYGRGFPNFEKVLLDCMDMHPLGRPRYVSLWDWSMDPGSPWEPACDFAHPVAVTMKDFENREVRLLRLRPRHGNRPHSPAPYPGA